MSESCDCHKKTGYGYGRVANNGGGVEEKAEFVLTLTYQEHDIYVQNNKLEIQLVFEFGFTLNTIIENNVYQKENVWVSRKMARHIHSVVCHR
jgi:hypothetical protein